MKPVLLARPHPFIVADMAPLLALLGFAPVKLEVLAHLAAMQARAFRGAIVSLAVSSTVAASAAEVTQTLRSSMPVLPLAFAGMKPFDVAAKTIERLFGGSKPSVVDIDSRPTPGMKLGTPGACIYLSREQIADPLRREDVKALLAAHFR